jgi:hypothetical protein
MLVIIIIIIIIIILFVPRIHIWCYNLASYLIEEDMQEYCQMRRFKSHAFPDELE